MSKTNTDVSSYYVTLPADITDSTQHSDVAFDLKVKKLELFAEWQVEDWNRNGISNKDEEITGLVITIGTANLLI